MKGRMFGWRECLMVIDINGMREVRMHGGKFGAMAGRVEEWIEGWGLEGLIDGGA
jgi:hypothetical protein